MQHIICYIAYMYDLIQCNRKDICPMEAVSIGAGFEIISVILSIKFIGSSKIPSTLF